MGVMVKLDTVDFYLRGADVIIKSALCSLQDSYSKCAHIEQTEVFRNAVSQLVNSHNPSLQADHMLKCICLP